MICECSDWKENINKANAGFAISAVHGFGGYSGKPWVYCPWCSKELVEIKP